MTILETERLIIRDYIDSDLPEYHKLLSDKQNMYFLDDITTNSLEESHESLKNAIEMNSGSKARRLCITLKDHGDDRLIGGVGYEIAAVTPLGKIADPMGWFIMPEFQNKGYITEAAQSVLEFAFSQDDCIRVVTGCYKDNVPTQKVMDKVGFRKEGERTMAAYHDGKMKTRLEYAINKDEWNNPHKKYSDTAFWQALDKLLSESKIIIDRPKGIRHPKYPTFLYPVDYGYLENTSSMDGGGIDVWRGTNGNSIDAIICTVDLLKKDSEIKILIGCNEDEKQLVLDAHNNSEYMRGLLVRRGV